MNQTILGLPIEAELPDDWTENGYHVSPVEAIAIVKAIDSNGDEVHAVVMTENMSPFEGGGLLNFGSIYVNELIRGTVKRAKNRSSKAKQASGETGS